MRFPSCFCQVPFSFSLHEWSSRHLEALYTYS